MEDRSREGNEIAHEQEPIRILVMVSKNHLLFRRAWDDTEEILPMALGILKEKNLIQHHEEPAAKLLVKKNFGLRIFVVFDIYHPNYDPAKGHLPEVNGLSVMVVHFNRKGVHARVAEAGLRQRINRETAEAHNLHGWDASPPYTMDHTSVVPIFMNPRDLSAPLQDERYVRPKVEELGND